MLNARKKLPVSINVLPSLDYIELVKLNAKTFDVEKTASLPCEYDITTRQLTDRDAIMQTIKDLYDSNRIPLNTPAVLTVPSFFTREIELPEEFSGEELRIALTSEAERFFIFKKNEPYVDWFKLPSGQIVYSVIPLAEIEKYVRIFEELKIPLLAIEINYLNIYKGLFVTGLLKEMLEMQSQWCLAVISNSTVFLSLNQGETILKTSESLLSSAEEEPELLIQEIEQDFNAFIKDISFDKLIIVHNTSSPPVRDISPAFQLYSGALVFIEQNESTLQSRGVLSAQFPCSLECIGGVFAQDLLQFKHFNFLPKANQHYQEQEKKITVAVKLLAMVTAANIAFLFLVWAGFEVFYEYKKSVRGSLEAQLMKVRQTVATQSEKQLNLQKFTKSVSSSTIKLNNFLTTLGENTTEGIWLENLSVTLPEGRNPIVKVEGATTDLGIVNTMLNPLSESLEQAEFFEVTKAEEKTALNTSQGNYFSWQIKNKDKDR
ncbi:MAG: hypothetical protein AAGI66_06015 [Cyanobacteria bacterium P01_H01_bin.74]